MNIIVENIKDNVNIDTWVVDKTSKPIERLVKEIKVSADWND